MFEDSDSQYDFMIVYVIACSSGFLWFGPVCESISDTLRPIRPLIYPSPAQIPSENHSSGVLKLRKPPLAGMFLRGGFLVDLEVFFLQNPLKNQKISPAAQNQ